MRAILRTSLDVILAALAANGVLWIYAATVFTTKGQLVEALRNE